MKRKYKDFLALQLLRKVFGYYLVIAILVTVTQLYLEYENTIDSIRLKMESLYETTNESISRSLWTYNSVQLKTTLEGLLKVSSIAGIKVTDKKSSDSEAVGKVGIIKIKGVNHIEKNGLWKPSKERLDLMSFTFPLIYTDQKDNKEVGTITIYSSYKFAYNQLRYTIFLIIVNSILKTIGLWIIFIFFAQKYVSRPLSTMKDSINRFLTHFDSDGWNKPCIHFDHLGFKNELEELQTGLRTMSADLLKYKSKVLQEKADLEEIVRHRTKELIVEKQKLEKSDQAKTMFLSNMSHELRTPLSAIIGYSELILEDVDAKVFHSIEKDAKKINSSGRHLLELVNLILDLNKVEDNSFELVPTKFLVADLLTEVRDIIKPLAKNNQNTLIIHGPENEYFIGDFTRFKQILLNLLSNAAKFTQKGELKLDLKVHHEDQRRVLNVTVTDTGQGISKDNLKRIFDEFVQVHDTSKDILSGTGLGLGLVKRLVKAAGGSIEVDSTLGQGTQFKLMIPEAAIKEHDSDNT